MSSPAKPRPRPVTRGSALARALAPARGRAGPALAALVAGLVAVAGCDVAVPSAALPSGTLRPAPTLSIPSFPPESTEAPTDEPEPTVAGPTLVPGSVVLDGPWPPGTAVRVVTDALDVRSQPRPRAPSLHVLDRGDVLILRGWPRRIGGRTWYEAIRSGTGGELPPLPASFGGGERVAGWVAVRDGGGSAVRPIRARCPDEVDLAMVGAMLPGERLACFGSDAITLTGTSGCLDCPGVPDGTADPDWLVGATTGELLSIDPRLRVGDLAMRFAPDGPPRPPAGSIIDVTGHFDDPAAAGCSMSVVVSSTVLRVARSLAVAACRTEFVVDDYEIVGHDPAFPTM